MIYAAETTHSNREGKLLQPLEGSPERPSTSPSTAASAPDDAERHAVITIERGKIRRLEEFLSRDEALEAVGLSEQDAHADS